MVLGLKYNKVEYMKPVDMFPQNHMLKGSKINMNIKKAHSNISLDGLLSGEDFFKECW
ncbi:hypothetical protein B14911_16950 [Bacillus sp. NRRL B-14911]|nr:hypothetical protein B14911_16950 [Bacillus sp. NRRL B-14911]